MAEINLVGVVTVTYNCAKVLPGFLHSMRSQAHSDYLLFVIDNASKDETMRLLGECEDGRLKVIENSENLGVAQGNNQGIQAALNAGCKSVLLINNDTEFGPSLLDELIAGIDQYQVHMTCPKILYYDAPDKIWAAGGAFQPFLGYRSIHLGVGAIDRGQWDVPAIVTYAPTCCVLIRASVFEEIGLMDERYFVYMDDVDFMYRAYKSGKKLFYLPKSKLLHKVGTSTGGETSPFHIHYCARNRMFFTLKHFGKLRAFAVALLYQVHLFLDVITGKTSLQVLKMKERATLEGVKYWNSFQ